LSQVEAVGAFLDLNPAERTVGRAIRRHVSDAVSRAESAPELFIKPDYVIQIFGKQDFAARIVHDVLHIQTHRLEICLSVWEDNLRGLWSRQCDDEYRYALLPRGLEYFLEITLGAADHSSVLAVR